VLPPSESGPSSLMSFWARQVRGDLPVRIKPVVAQSSGVPGLYGRIGFSVRGQGAPTRSGSWPRHVYAELGDRYGANLRAGIVPTTPIVFKGI
jgi:hypothetical protein